MTHERTRSVPAWIVDPGEPTETHIDGVGYTTGARNYGESYTYSLAFRDSTGPRLESALVRYDTMLDRCRYAGSFTQKEMQARRTGYVAEWPEHAAPLLMHLRPVDHRTTPDKGLWGLIAAAEPGQEPITRGHDGPVSATLDVEIVYLAETSEYETREDVREDLEYPGLL